MSDPFGLSTWWAGIKTHDEPADIYLAQLESIDQLTPADAFEVIQAIQGKLDRGEIPGDQEAVARLRTRLADLYNEYLAKSAVEEIAIEPPAGLVRLTTEIKELEDLVDQAEETLYFKVTQWRDRWWAEAIARFGRHGSPFFAEGGQPIIAFNQAMVEKTALNLRRFINTQMVEMRVLLKNLEVGIYFSGEKVPPERSKEIQPKIISLYNDYTAAEDAANGKILAFMNTYDLFLGMQNFTNLINQYVIGKYVFGLLNWVIGKPLTWLARMTKAGRETVTVAKWQRAQELAAKMAEIRQPFAHKGYVTKAAREKGQFIHEMLIHGVPVEAPAALPQVPALNWLEKSYVAKYGKLPAEYIAAQPEELRKLMGIGFAALASQVGAELKVRARDTLDKAVPGGIDAFIKDRLTPLAEAGELKPGAIETEINQWFEENKEQIEETTLDEAAAIADTLVEDFPIPTAARAEELDYIEKEMWARRVITFYDGIGEAREYTMAVQLFGELQAERGGAKSEEATTWIDGLILAAETYLLAFAHEQGLYPELGVERKPEAFITEMKLETE